VARIKVTRGSGNVFADLELPQPEERLAKAALARELARLIRDGGLTQKAAADLLEIDQPKASHLLHGRLAGFSTERLMAFLTALGRDVEIVVKAAPPSRRRGRMRVIAA
jgi:predicted XRE-type DNA-binding protein